MDTASTLYRQLLVVRSWTAFCHSSRLPTKKVNPNKALKTSQNRKKDRLFVRTSLSRAFTRCTPGATCHAVKKRGIPSGKATLPLLYAIENAKEDRRKKRLCDHGCSKATVGGTARSYVRARGTHQKQTRQHRFFLRLQVYKASARWLCPIAGGSCSLEPPLVTCVNDKPIVAY